MASLFPKPVKDVFDAGYDRLFRKMTDTSTNNVLSRSAVLDSDDKQLYDSLAVEEARQLSITTIASVFFAVNSATFKFTRRDYKSPPPLIVLLEEEDSDGDLYWETLPIYDWGTTQQTITAPTPPVNTFATKTIATWTAFKRGVTITYITPAVKTSNFYIYVLKEKSPEA